MSFGLKWVNVVCESFARGDKEGQAGVSPAATAALAWFSGHASSFSEKASTDVCELAVRQVIPQIVPSPLLTTLEGMWGLCGLAAKADAAHSATNLGDLLAARVPAAAAALAARTSSEETVMRGFAKLRLKKDVADLERKLAASKAAEAAAVPAVVVADGASLVKHLPWLRAVRSGPTLFVTQLALAELDALKMGVASKAGARESSELSGESEAEATTAEEQHALARQAQAAIAWLEASVARGQGAADKRTSRGPRVELESGAAAPSLLAACEALQPGAALMTDDADLLAEAQRLEVRAACGSDAKRWWCFEQAGPRSGSRGRGRGRGHGRG
jgi:hypothetical protein